MVHKRAIVLTHSTLVVLSCRLRTHYSRRDILRNCLSKQEVKCQMVDVGIGLDLDLGGEDDEEDDE